ncbi:MAG TPA: protein-L-isoaspartate(D-aspartate) O-methyltransferase [Terracidiphilus sp.]|nr:protein-L-isoaspartate(D-aspartate) O-methyltransferase [Terracidiphilus sp.]
MAHDWAHPIHTHPVGTEESQADRLRAHRRSYAKHITAVAGMSPDIGLGREIADALASIPRERFVRPPPWRIVSPEGNTYAVSDDPAVLYQDVLVPLSIGRGLNNGQPSLHAMCLNALAPRKGESAVHVGAGTGYYTAVLAMLVGEAGKVDAYEIEPELARQAAENLAEFPQVTIHSRSGAEGPLPPCDVLYVNAAAAEPLAVWFDALLPDGRLLFPLEPQGEAGQMLLVTRKADGSYPARLLWGVQFVACAGAQDVHAARVLDAAFRKGNWSQVRQLYRNDQPDDSCWCAGRGWWLSTR